MLRRFLRFSTAALALAGALSAPVAAAPADDLREAQKLYSQARLQPALEKVEAYLKAQPREPQGRFLKGLVLTEQKRVSEAIQVFTGLTEDFPELPEPYNNLAVLYASQGHYDKAKAALELATHTHPSYATAHENLGDIYAQLASRAYDRALQLDKNNTTVQVKLAIVKDLFVALKAGASAKPEPSVAPKAEPPKAAPAKPGPAQAPKAEPAKVAVAKAVPGAAPAAGGDKDAVRAAIEAWASAWCAKDVKAYLAAYAPDFEPPDGESREAWEKLRTERVERAKSMEVSLKIQSIAVEGDAATAVFRQAYRSDPFKSNSTKTLKLSRFGGKWLIKQERVGG